MFTWSIGRSQSSQLRLKFTTGWSVGLTTGDSIVLSKFESMILWQIGVENVVMLSVCTEDICLGEEYIRHKLIERSASGIIERPDNGIITTH